ncbi:hypothetical protein AVEN_38063-1 [Araneus ventricosus]|uniref:BHLH domain-containing protein n=1 Tax=Araneus ventricosus TaxID=182803 RepID=A0A4Y2IZI0_ARAVE|nr:hypothetical protein AVEN_38063-1 [Araneus ventricosus]
MNCTERTMATTPMDLPATLNSSNFASHGALRNNLLPDRIIGSEELNRIIEADLECGCWDEDYVLKLRESFMSPPVLEILEDNRDFYGPLDLLPEAFSLMVDPRTGMPFKSAESPKKHLSQELPKPYHPYQDHDYLKIEEDDESDGGSGGLAIINDIFNSKDEPVVEVWEIDTFNKPPAADPVPQPPSSYRQTFNKETRRTSTRTADIRRREQARKFSNAVHAVLKNEKAQRIRQYKNIKPKNSVETTPSQSDIEEWSSQPVRPTYTKITKKKTSKGRIDHSESERHRREVLRRNFSSLSDLVPHEYLRGEKVTSQISKQKILNGAKAYIGALSSSKSSYKSCYHHNRFLRGRLQKKCSPKLVKCVKKRK